MNNTKDLDELSVLAEQVAFLHDTVLEDFFCSVEIKNSDLLHRYEVAQALVHIVGRMLWDISEGLLTLANAKQNNSLPT